MLVGDTNYKKRLQFRNQLEKTRALTSSALAFQDNEVRKTLPVDGFDPRRFEHQLGRGLWWKELVRRIQKMNPTLKMEDSPSSPDKTLALLYPDVEKADDGGVKHVWRFLCAFDKVFLPEWTQLLPVYDWAWDTEKRDFVQVLKTTRFLRGWREVLIRLLRSKLIKQEDVNALFPTAAQRKSWHELLKLPPRERKQNNGPLVTLGR